MEIIKKLSAVMEAVGAVSKDGRNTAQNFNFRGIDAVVNAVSPALRKEGVVVVPRLVDKTYDTVTTTKGSQMSHIQVVVEYCFYAPDGSHISATTAGEAFDSGDKATAKAMSVAFRTALLQALCLPTDEIDPDAESYERSPKKTSAPQSSAPSKQVAPKPALSPAHQKWITDQIEKKHQGEDVIVFVGDVINRTIKSLDEVTDEEGQRIVQVLAGKQ